jgi:hypothetical protein
VVCGTCYTGSSTGSYQHDWVPLVNSALVNPQNLAESLNRPVQMARAFTKGVVLERS